MAHSAWCDSDRSVASPKHTCDYFFSNSNQHLPFDFKPSILRFLEV